MDFKLQSEQPTITDSLTKPRLNQLRPLLGLLHIEFLPNYLRYLVCLHLSVPVDFSVLALVTIVFPVRCFSVVGRRGSRSAICVFDRTTVCGFGVAWKRTLSTNVVGTARVVMSRVDVF